MTLRFDLYLLDDTETDLHRLLVRRLWGVVSMTETMYTRIHVNLYIGGGSTSTWACIFTRWSKYTRVPIHMSAGDGNIHVRL